MLPYDDSGSFESKGVFDGFTIATYVYSTSKFFIDFLFYY